MTTFPSVAFTQILMLSGMAWLVSCSTPPPEPKTEAFKMYEWNGDGVSGTASIVIYLDKQKAEFYRDHKMVGWTYVATGRPSHPTPAGDFKITEKKADKVSNLYGKLLDADGKVVNSDFNTSTDTVPENHTFDPAKMPLFMRLTNDGVGMHVGPIPKPGNTASHGCIRLPRFMAQKFFTNTVIGTTVSIRSTSPDSEQEPPEKNRKRSGNFASN